MRWGRGKIATNRVDFSTGIGPTRFMVRECTVFSHVGSKCSVPETLIRLPCNLPLARVSFIFQYVIQGVTPNSTNLCLVTGGREEIPHATKPEAKGGGWEGQPHFQGAMSVREQEGLEQLSHIEGQEGWQ